MQSQRLLFKPADHNQLQPIQLLSTCNTWYQEKCAQASANNAAIQTSTRCRLCAHASVCACRHAGWPAGYSPGWLVVMSDWLPAGFITLRQRQKQTLWPPHLQVSLSLFLLLSVSPPLCLFLSLAVCLSVRLSRALRRVLADFGFAWQAELWGSTLIEETEQKLTLLSLKQLSSSARWSHRWYAHGKEIHVKTLTHVHTGWFTHATIGQLTGTVVAPVMYVEANKHPSLSPHPAYASQFFNN